MFIAFDGIDGVGKSTQVKLLTEGLRDRDYEVVVCRDPGSTPLGERIRELLLTADEATPISRRSEMLLYMAARAQLVEEVIRPALAAAKVVIADRYLLANVVYQGHAGGLNPDEIWTVGQIATQGLQPDAVLLLDMAPDAAGNRMNRPLDRMEDQGTEYRERLRAGFLYEAKRNPKIHLIAADRPIPIIQADIWQIVNDLLPTKR
jgi:dTMP kinase